MKINWEWLAWLLFLSIFTSAVADYALPHQPFWVWALVPLGASFAYGVITALLGWRFLREDEDGSGK